jgi:peptidoglycan-associated lipoprotein
MMFQMMRRHAALAALLAATAAVAACNRSGTLPDESAANGVSDGAGASTSSSGGGGGITVSPLEEQRAREREQLMQQLVIYFDYDQAEILPEFNAMLAAHGQYLAQNPNTQVRLEGHADERGSREYNIGLGERRAQAVRRVLMLQGASGEQLSTVSYGEERPATVGSDDEAWRLNRRVELVYR